MAGSRAALLDPSPPRLRPMLAAVPPEMILIVVIRSDSCVPRRRALASLTSQMKCSLVFAVLDARTLLALSLKLVLGLAYGGQGPGE